MLHCCAFNARFHYGSVLVALNLQHTATRRIIKQKARSHTFPLRDIVLLPLVSVRFQILFHSPNRGSFHLSLALLVHYRLPYDT